MSELWQSTGTYLGVAPDVSGLLAGTPLESRSKNSFGLDTLPSPVDKWVLNPAALIEHNKGAMTSSFEHHALGIGRPMSDKPGMDTDHTSLVTEGLRLEDRPRLVTPVEGSVTMVKQDPWGTTRIVDRNGWTHTFVHGQVAAPAPSGRNYFYEVGDQARMGDYRGYLSNQGTRKDHDHYYLQDPNGQFHDPANVYRSRLDGAIEGIIDLERENRVLQDRQFLEDLGKPGPGSTWDDRWDLLPNIA